MSDLVDKVVKSVGSEYFHTVLSNAEARAAIRAVLAHFAEAGNVTDGMGIALERALSEGDGGRDLSGKYKLRAIAAAMAAALKEMEP